MLEIRGSMVDGQRFARRSPQRRQALVSLTCTAFLRGVGAAGAQGADGGDPRAERAGHPAVAHGCCA
eukprot:385768-Prorocentrum_minimum.AAC.1